MYDVKREVVIKLKNGGGTERQNFLFSFKLCTSVQLKLYMKRLFVVTKIRNIGFYSVKTKQIVDI